MAKCKHCGEWAGVASDVHDECAELKAKGWTDAQISAHRSGRDVQVAPKEPRVLNRTDIIFGVFFGNLFFAIVIAVFYLFVYLIGAAGRPAG
jgi:hypothetical protein